MSSLQKREVFIDPKSRSREFFMLQKDFIRNKIYL